MAKDARRSDERINLMPMEIRIDVGKHFSKPMIIFRSLARIAHSLINSRAICCAQYANGYTVFWVSCFAVAKRLGLAIGDACTASGSCKPAFARIAWSHRPRDNPDHL